jgi:IS5 family transposase
MLQRTLLTEDIAYDRLDKMKDPLTVLDDTVDWSIFRKSLKEFRSRNKGSNAGRKPYDPLLMFKILILQALYNLSDEAMEFQVRDRLSFLRFLGLSLADRVPDAKTIWLFREQLTQAGLVEPLFKLFDDYIRQCGLQARKGQIIDASFVKVPIQRNSRDENKRIKTGNPPEDWDEHKQRQKDVDARWAKKNGKSYYGYKNHIEIDSDCKIIRYYAVTDSSVHDSRVFTELLDPTNTNADVYADSAYWSAEKVGLLKDLGYRQKIQRKGQRNKPLSNREKQGNRTRSKTRSRVEHVFGAQVMKAGNLIVRSIGKARATTAIGLRNLAYNMTRFSYLVTHECH